MQIKLGYVVTTRKLLPVTLKSNYATKSLLNKMTYKQTRSKYIAEGLYSL